MKTPDRYTCEDLFRKLDDYLDQVLSGREVERIEEHLEQCASCAAEYRFEQSLLTEVRGKLRRVPAAEGTPDLMRRIARLLDAAEAEVK